MVTLAERAHPECPRRYVGCALACVVYSASCPTPSRVSAQSRRDASGPCRVHREKTPSVSDDPRVTRQGSPRASSQETRPSVLIIGYGNISRRDDGVAFHIIQRLRGRLGLRAWFPDAEVDDGENAGLETTLVHQLAPELAETLASFEVVVFVDAHVEGARRDPVHWEEITPAYRAGIVAHHLEPSVVLALCQILYGSSPRGYLLSVLGADFDFGDLLSPSTSQLADQAVDVLLDLLSARGIVPSAT